MEEGDKDNDAHFKLMKEPKSLNQNNGEWLRQLKRKRSGRSSNSNNISSTTRPPGKRRSSCEAAVAVPAETEGKQPQIQNKDGKNSKDKKQASKAKTETNRHGKVTTEHVSDTMASSPPKTAAERRNATTTPKTIITNFNFSQCSEITMKLDDFPSSAVSRGNIEVKKPENADVKKVYTEPPTLAVQEVATDENKGLEKDKNEPDSDPFQQPATSGSRPSLFTMPPPASPKNKNKSSAKPGTSTKGAHHDHLEDSLKKRAPRSRSPSPSVPLTPSMQLRDGIIKPKQQEKAGSVTSRKRKKTSDDDASLAAMVSTSSSWNCAHCTFENVPRARKCGMCHTRKNMALATTKSTTFEAPPSSLEPPAAMLVHQTIKRGGILEDGKSRAGTSGNKKDKHKTSSTASLGKKGELKNDKTCVDTVSSKNDKNHTSLTVSGGKKGTSENGKSRLETGRNKKDENQISSRKSRDKKETSQNDKTCLETGSNQEETDTSSTESRGSKGATEHYKSVVETVSNKKDKHQMSLTESRAIYGALENDESRLEIGSAEKDENPTSLTASLAKKGASENDRSRLETGKAEKDKNHSVFTASRDLLENPKQPRNQPKRTAKSNTVCVLTTRALPAEEPPQKKQKQSNERRRSNKKMSESDNVLTTEPATTLPLPEPQNPRPPAAEQSTIDGKRLAMETRSDHSAQVVMSKQKYAALLQRLVDAEAYSKHITQLYLNLRQAHSLLHQQHLQLGTMYTTSLQMHQVQDASFHPSKQLPRNPFVDQQSTCQFSGRSGLIEGEEAIHLPIACPPSGLIPSHLKFDAMREAKKAHCEEKLRQPNETVPSEETPSLREQLAQRPEPQIPTNSIGPASEAKETSRHARETSTVSGPNICVLKAAEYEQLSVGAPSTEEESLSRPNHMLQRTAEGRCSPSRRLASGQIKACDAVTDLSQMTLRSTQAENHFPSEPTQRTTQHSVSQILLSPPNQELALDATGGSRSNDWAPGNKMKCLTSEENEAPEAALDCNREETRQAADATTTSQYIPDSSRRSALDENTLKPRGPSFRKLPLANSTNKQAQAPTNLSLVRKQDAWQSNATSRLFINEMVSADTAQEQVPLRAAAEWHSAKRGPTSAVTPKQQDLWDDLPGPHTQQEGLGHKYEEVVRCRSKRQGLSCRDCPDCKAFYDVLRRSGDNIAFSQNTMQFSRHRTWYTPPQTPEDFWCMDFIDEKRKAEQQEVEKKKTARQEEQGQLSDS